MMKKNALRIGLYGGSFDPIHFGHLNLAIEMKERHQLDEVWLCPTAVNPLKGVVDHVDGRHRLKMAYLAVENVPGLSVLDLEFQREGPSFTTDTLRELLALQAKGDKKDQFFLILGEDAAHSFHLWREPEQVIKQAHLLIGQRNACHVESQKFSYEGSLGVVHAIQQGFTFIRLMEISSTDIRERLNKKLYCGHLLPGKVLDYIIANDLYLLRKK